MVAKMKYISITGHIGSMNHVVSRYLSRYDIQLEQASSELMKPFTTLNPYAQTLRKAEMFAGMVDGPPAIYVPMTAAAAVNLVEEAAAAYERRDERLKEAEVRLFEVRKQIEVLRNFTSLDMELSNNLEFIHCRLGRLTAAQFRRYERFLQDDEKILFIPAKREKDFVHGAYFTPVSHRDEADAAFASLEFLPADLPAKTAKTPAALLHHLRLEVLQTEKDITELTHNTLGGVCGKEKLAIACAKVKNLYAAFDVKKYAAISRGRRVFTFSGWMSQNDADSLASEISGDDLALFTCYGKDSESGEADQSRPPTLLKNLPIIRQFEFFTRLYGLPDYGEIDPTPLLAVTYTLLFGLMFGDIGHGMVLALLGILVQRRWHPDLGGIMTVVGASAAFFGVLYGSIFGFEFRPLWMRPQADIMSTIVFAAALGAGLITLSMLLNMYNAFRRGRIGELLFSANGVAGLMFYGAALWILVRVLVQGHPLTLPVVLLAVLPLIFVSFKHPLENLLAGHRIRPKESIGQFIFNTIIETFETLLTYATNTISFVRVGAFAVSHAGMMHVVLQLSRGAAGAQNILILVFGNVLVMGIEGLLVGIQVLRLDFYEIFSRFYKGGGRAFEETYSKR
ncbi:MAG: hypothetical protein FWB91_01605 [Defluviitaleaceae bacterium]|nr:hypothetical protein [Defluviitaleaceae bacterium]